MTDPDSGENGDSSIANRRQVLLGAGALGVPALAGAASGRSSGPSAAPRQTEGADVGEDPAILVVSLTPGYRHESIPAGNEALRGLGDRIAEETGADEVVVDVIASADDDTPPTEFPTDVEELSRYDALVFQSSNDANPPDSTETLVLNDEQAAAFEEYIRGGGGFVGIHSAVDNQTRGSFFIDLIGTYYEGHPAVQEVRIDVEDTTHPSTTALPEVWELIAEPYNFLSNPRGDVHVLASLDESSYENAGMEGTDHPITWAQHYAGGRSWYTGLGHRPEIYENEQFLDHLLGGIMWAAGYVDGGAVDSASVTFEDQESDGSSVTVASATLYDGGFLVLHAEDGSVVGVSDMLEAGTHEDVEVELFEFECAPSDGSGLGEGEHALTAMAHVDSDLDDEFDFVSSDGEDDGPYTEGGSPVTDDATVTVAADAE